MCGAERCCGLTPGSAMTVIDRETVDRVSSSGREAGADAAAGAVVTPRSTRARVAALLLQSGGAVQTAASLPSPRTALTPPRPPSLAMQDAAEAASHQSSNSPTSARLRRVMTTTPRAVTPLRRSAAMTDDAVAALLGGSVVDTGVVVVDRVVPRSERLAGPKNLAPLLRRGTPHTDIAQDDLVYLDTETTGLAGGTGTVVFILGLARVEGDVVAVRQFVLTGFAGERALLSGAHEWLDAASGLVTYNGLSFDIPLLLTRFRMAELPARHRDTLSGLPHLDLLHPMRAAFGREWPNCTLQMAEQQLLHHHRVDDLPGSMVPAVFTDLIRYGRTQRLRPALDHNSDDLVSLTSMVDILGAAYAGNGVGQPGGIARRLIRQGDHERAFTLLRAAAETLDERDDLLLAKLTRRAERLERQRQREAAQSKAPAAARRRRARMSS